MKSSRREFIKHTGLAGVAFGNAGLKSTLGGIMSPESTEQNISFISPVDGDMLCSYDGAEGSGYLQTKVKIMAPKGMEILLNGTRTIYEEGMYSADIRLSNYKNGIEAVDVKTGDKTGILVYWLKNYTHKYRLSLDDNIWFLQDINKNANIYHSIFENPYLGFLKQVHDTYGTKIHLNLFYQTEGFNLSQMTDKYKPEWKENSGWLRLSFHALQNKPDKPYIQAGYDEVKKDCDLVMNHIRRFAGEELMGPVTTLHWGEATVEGCRALRDAGYTGLAGYFNVDDSEPVSYYLDMEKRKQLFKRFIWRDNREGIIFARMAIVINTVELDQIVPYLDNLGKDTHKPSYADLMIHEQYFYPFYKDYQPDYREKVLTAVKWAAENGYHPAFLSECIFG
jgi:hypothetical protein